MTLFGTVVDLGQDLGFDLNRKVSNGLSGRLSVRCPADSYFGQYTPTRPPQSHTPPGSTTCAALLILDNIMASPPEYDLLEVNPTELAASQAQPSGQSSTQGRKKPLVVVDDQHPFDLDAYIGAYSGELLLLDGRLTGG